MAMPVRGSPRLDPRGVGLEGSRRTSYVYGARYGGFKNDHFMDGREGYDWDRDHFEKPPKTLNGVLTRFAAYTSIQGVPFINRARRWYSRLAWSVIFILGLVATSVQLYLVIDKYLDRETTSNVQIGYTTLDFPSVTICNLNPLRDSWIDRDTDLGDFLDSIKPRDDYQTNFTNEDLNPGARVKRQAQDGAQPPPGLGSSFLGDMNKKESGYDKYLESLSPEEIGEIDDTFGGGESSAFSYIEDTFKSIVADLPRESRVDWGHTGELFILDCSFNGRVCSYLNFTQSLHIRYGNCFTFNSADMMSKALKAARGGAPYGLNLILYIEKNEYIPGFTTGSGVRVAIHPFNTMPFLEEHGMSAAPGFETFIGMKMINMSRLGSPYTDCGDKGTFKREHNRTYSLDGCLNTCMDRLIVKECKCYRATHPEYYTTQELTRFPPCNETGLDFACTQPILTMVTKSRNKCQCNEACKETQYDVITSSNRYPEGNIWHALVDTVCGIDDTACDYIYRQEMNQADILRDNVLQIRIFFRDLNFQSISEIAAYDEYQFLSDLGGSLGLWVGASALTVLETFDLFLNLCKFCCCDKHKQMTGRSRRHKTRKTTRQEDHSIPSTSRSHSAEKYKNTPHHNPNGLVFINIDDIR